MKLKRRKQYKKTLAHYRFAFGLKKPYTVLVDGNILHVAMQKKFDFRKLLQDIFEDENVDLCVTGSILHELKELGEQFQEAYRYATGLKKLKVGSGKGEGLDKTAAASIEALIGNSNRHGYCVATQHEALKAKLRLIPGVPLIFATKSSIMLEEPSTASKEKWESLEVKKQASNVKKDVKAAASTLSVVNKPAAEAVRAPIDNVEPEGKSINNQDSKAETGNDENVEQEAEEESSISDTEHKPVALDKAQTNSGKHSQKRKARKISMPNPLSMKRPKLDHNKISKSDDASSKTGRKRKRNRSKTGPPSTDAAL